jgi:peptide deformylase
MEIVQRESDLKKPCDPVEDPMSEGLEIADKLFAVLDSHPGIGLAANQIGIQKKVFVLNIPRTDSEENKTTWYRRSFVNPELLEKRTPFIFKKEGCLSYPGRWVETIRFHDIIVRCSLNTEPLSLSGLEAVAWQHENDHLNGLTMLDSKLKNYTGNESCICGSGRKFKKCCYPSLKPIDL